jgi:hypothetical protein
VPGRSGAGGHGQAHVVVIALGRSKIAREGNRGHASIAHERETRDSAAARSHASARRRTPRVGLAGEKRAIAPGRSGVGRRATTFQCRVAELRY